MDQIDKLEENIKNLKIQGATNVALATIDGILSALSQINIDGQEGNLPEAEKIVSLA